jgi:hypothetical protein
VRQCFKSVGHAGGGFRRGQTVVAKIGMIAISPDGRILNVHRGNARYFQVLGDGIADLDAAYAITAGIKGRPGDNDLGLFLLHRRENCLERVVLVLMKLVVAEVHGASDGCILAQLQLQPARCPSGAVVDANRNTGLVLAADTGEKLIDDMNNCNHSSSFFGSTVQRQNRS